MRKLKHELTERQRQCLDGVLNLRSAKEIARDLGISPHAVEKHLKVSREKLGASSSAEAARLYALRKTGTEIPPYGLSDLEDPGIRNQKKVSPAMAVGHDMSGIGATGDDELPEKLSAIRTLSLIVAVSFGSIVSLLMLIACAQALNGLL